MLIELDVDRAVAMHLVLATRRHRLLQVQEGKPCPPALAEIEAQLVEAARSDTDRQEPPRAATVGTQVHDGFHVRDREWLSIREAAAVTGIGVRTLERRIAEGSLRSSRVGRCRRIARPDLTKFMESQR